MGARGMGNLTYSERAKLVNQAASDLKKAKANETRTLNKYRAASGAVIAYDWEQVMRTSGAEAADAGYRQKIAERDAAQAAYDKAVTKRGQVERRLERVRIKNRRQSDEPLF